MPETPPSSWFGKMRKRISSQYPHRSEESKDRITAGIWHGYPQETKEKLTRELEKSFSAMLKAVRDFGGWTSHNADWERGYREGERKAEDRSRGIQTQRDRLTQFAKKAQQEYVAYGSDPDDPTHQQQRIARQEGLRHRAGETKEQHQGVGKVPVGPRELKPLKVIDTKPVEKSEKYAMFAPIRIKSVASGEVYVEGTVSMPVKDLQGDLIEMPALVQAKDAMTHPPHDLVWLDHESPYARPDLQAAPPIGKFMSAKILQGKGEPELYAKMIVNKMHPRVKQVIYELEKGFYNAFSMEFIPVREALKQIGGKLVNAISEIKYFATSLVRAPANEGATIAKVYTKAFANSVQFCPIRVKGLGWIGQTVMEKKSTMSLKEVEPEPEEEPEPEGEPEDEPELEPEPLGRRKDYDRQTGSTAPERASTAIGEWGDPALDKARAQLKEHGQRLRALEKYALSSSNMLKTIARNTALMGKSLGLDLKGIDEDTLETLGEEEGPGLEGEQTFPEVEHGKMGAPKKQRIITTFPGPALPGEEVEDQEVGTKWLANFITKTVRVAVDRAVDGKTVVRKGFSEQAGPVPESVKRMERLKQDDGSIESQLAIIDAYKA